MRYLLPYLCFLLSTFAATKRTNDRIVKFNLKMFIATLSLLCTSQDIHCIAANLQKQIECLDCADCTCNGKTPDIALPYLINTRLVKGQ